MGSKCATPERVDASERLLRTRPTFSETVMVSVKVTVHALRYYTSPAWSNSKTQMAQMTQ